MKDKYKKAYMKTAEVFAELSHARRLKVGAVVVKDNRVISIGYNGMPAGWDNDCETRVYATEWNIDNAEWEYREEDSGHPYNLKTRPEVLHAEANAVTKLAKSTESGDGAVLFITHSPCLECAKLIFQSGIRSVFYRDSYRSSEGVSFLERSGVEVEQLTDV